MSKIANINFDDLSNNEWRAHCIEYGLPNVPVTDTSRKLLIKRLQSAISGGKKTERTKSPSRRETIHEVKVAASGTPKKQFPDNTSKSNSNRRITLANVENSNTRETRTIETIKKVVTERKPVLESSYDVNKTNLVTNGLFDDSKVYRRVPAFETRTGGRITPISGNISENYQTDYGTTIAQDRFKRSPSLSKSETVTTSYKHDVYVPDKIYEKPAVSAYRTDLKDVQEKEIRVERNPVQTSSYVSHVPSPSRNFESTSSAGNQYGLTSNYASYRPNAQTRSYDDYDEEEEDVDVDKNAPYLSDFARRLSRLKAEPLVGSSVNINPDFNPVRRRDIAPQNKSAVHSFYQFCEVFARKYNLKGLVFVFGAIIILALIFILFINN